MNPVQMTSRVTRESSVAVAILAVLGACLGGPWLGLGVMAGGALALVNFRWLSRRIRAVLTGPEGPAAPSLASGLRLVALMGASAGVIVSGWAHPVGVLIGLTVLPCDLIVRGLRAARAET